MNNTYQRVVDSLAALERPGRLRRAKRVDSSQQLLITSIVQVVVGIVTVIALIMGPILAVRLSDAQQQSTEIRNRRFALFQTLVAYRGEFFNPDRLRALAVIDIVYFNNRTVREKWKAYYDALNDPNYADGKNDGINVWRRKENYLLAEMALALGMDKDIRPEDVERVYLPKFVVSNLIATQNTSKEFLRVLQNSEHFGSNRREPPPDAGAPQTG